MEPVKIGVISCSGEDCLGGTISRLATKKILDEIRPGQGVTICLPLFIAGGEQERRFAQVFPTITVDGCSKFCARKATEKFSGKVDEAIQVGNLIGESTARNATLSTRHLTEEHWKMADRVAEEIRVVFDELSARVNQK